MATLFRTAEQRQRFSARALGSVIATIVPLAIYLFYLSSDVGFKDNSAFVYRSVDWGITHPTGYPLMMIISRLFVLLPFGSIALKANLFSAVFGALTCLALFHFFCEVFEKPSVAFTGALTFCLGQTFLLQSLHAEVYTLNTFFVALVLVMWRRLAKYSGSRRLLLTAFIFGLGLTNHITLILLLPALVFSLLLEGAMREDLSPMDYLSALAVGALPVFSLSFFTLIYLPESPYFDHDQSTISNLISFVTGSQYHHMLFALDADGIVSRIGVYIYFLVRDYTLFLPIGALFGLIACVVRWPHLLPPLTLFYLGHIVFTLNYAVEDIEVFFLPTYLALCIFLTFFYRVTLDVLEEVNPYLGTVFLVLPIFLPVYLLLFQHSGVLHQAGALAPSEEPTIGTLQGHTLARRYFQELPPNAVFAVEQNWRHTWTLQYIHEVERWRDDIDFMIFEGPTTTLQLANHAQRGRPVFVEEPVFAKRAGNKELVLRKVAGEDVSASMARFIERQTPGTLILLAEKNEGKRLISPEGLAALESIGFAPGLFAQDNTGVLGVGVVGAEDGGSENRLTETFDTLSLSPGTQLPNTSYPLEARITINVGTWTMGNFANIFVDGNDYSPRKRGLNMIAMSPTSRFVDSTRTRTFDVHEREIFTRYEVVGIIDDTGFNPTPTFLEQLDLSRLNMDYTRVSATDPDEEQRFLLGWGDIEGEERWVTGKNAYFAATFQETLTQRLVFRTRTLPTETPQRCVVKFNGTEIGSFTYPEGSGESIERYFFFPPDKIKDGVNIFSFSFSQTTKPSSLGRSRDNRDLAAAFDFLEVTAPPQAISAEPAPEPGQ